MTLDNSSANSIINEGIRLVVKKKLEELSTLRKNRNSLAEYGFSIISRGVLNPSKINQKI
jgi:hypothetical protein